MTTRKPARTINVTADHIADGEWKDAERCAVALALSQDNTDQWYVDTNYVYLSERNSNYIRYAKTGSYLREFIKSFDEGESYMRPITIGVYEDNYDLEVYEANRYMEIIDDDNEDASSHN